MWTALRQLLFRVDAESIHDLSVRGIRTLGSVSSQALEILSGRHHFDERFRASGKSAIDFCQKKLPHPVGLAAGFDKNALLLPYLSALGFSFAEIGSVTLRAQSGNEKPRLFRGGGTLFNRMGFNNDGAEAIARRLDAYTLPDNFAVGINLGINKDTAREEAAQSYARCFDILKNFGDYFVVNVSSPNTAGLRSLQTLQDLEKIFSALHKVSSKKPIFLKLAPEFESEERDALFHAAANLGIAGFVLTNTLQGLYRDKTGGWSGEVLREKSRAALVWAHARTKLPILSVGGIMDVAELHARMEGGAKLVQIYTGWIFAGPRFPSQLAEAWLDER